MDLMLLLKASLLLSAALVAGRVLRRASAASRHRVWTVAFAALLALPVLAAALPGFDVPVPAGWWATADAGPGGPPDLKAGPTPDPIAAPEAHPNVMPMARPLPTRDAGQALQTPPQAALARFASHGLLAPGGISSRGLTTAAFLVAWLIGTAVAAGALILSLVRVGRLSRAAEPVADSAWHSAAAMLGARLGLRRGPRLLVSPRVSTPMAGGLWRPVVFLPAASRTWSAEQRDVVLAHEIAHLACRDPLRHLVARLAVAVYWFHPLAWIAARRAAMSREQACDEAVLALGTRPSTYARVLLDIAAAMPQPVPALGALPMVEHPLLERRLMTILSTDRRPSNGRWRRLPALGGAVLTLSIAAAHPAVPAASPEPAATHLSARADLSLTVPPPSRAARSSVRVAAPVPAGVQADVERESPCWLDPSRGTTFSGKK
jgi:beta-lactamase regulating signal transducer with metallopeptidase domain